MTPKTLEIAVIGGSLRKESLHRKLIAALDRLAGGSLNLTVLELGDLPLYNDDLWADPPPPVLRLKQQIAAADGVIFASPEYNRSLSPVLKNAIDWASRPRGQGVWTGKPASVLSLSPGQIGGAVGLSHLRNVAAVIGLHLLGQPEVQISYRPGLIADDLSIPDEALRAFLSQYLAAFEAWVRRFQS